MSLPLCTVMHIKIYVVLEFLDYCKGKSQNSERQILGLNKNCKIKERIVTEKVRILQRQVTFWCLKSEISV